MSRVRSQTASLAQAWQLRQTRILLEHIKPEPGWRILDFGGTGQAVKTLFPDHGAITVCDPSEEGLAIARSLRTDAPDATGTLPFADKEFDFVFCAGVIEHVTGPKRNLARLRASLAFKDEAWRHQFAFAQEIQRIAKRFFVETPHKYFLIESHTWLPLPFNVLPRPQQIDLLNLSNRLRIKTPVPDWNLLVTEEMQQLFPDAVVVVDRAFKVPRSIMAIQA